MKRLKKALSILLIFTLALSALCMSASAKTNPGGQTVDTVLFYVRNSAGEDILVSHMTVAEMEADIAAGLIDGTNHNYSLLDRYVTTVHQEAQGFTVPELVDYARSKSEAAELRTLPLTYAGNDKVAFWEIDQTGFDEMDTYSYNELYGVARYNFPLLYQYWDYRTQDYYDPAGVMSRDEVIDYILANGEQENVLLSVRAFSQRYMVTDEKYESGDYNMENLWQNKGVMDNQRTIRLMKPMTEAELRGKTSTAADTRYWIANILLDMDRNPDITPLGTVAAPTAVMTEDESNYYIAFSCATAGATILFNHNYASPSYTPSCEYTGGSVVVPKSSFPNGSVIMTCSAVKDGYTDAGVVTLELKPSGIYKGGSEWNNPFSDVKGSDWYYDAVAYVVSEGLFNGTSDTAFTPDDTMSRAMFATVLHRYAGRPQPLAAAPFTDIPAGTWYSDAAAWAYENGHINGTGNDKFSPTQDISLEQMLTILWRYKGSPAAGEALPDGLGSVSSWAASAVGWAVKAGILDGVSGTLTAQGSATRSQVAAILRNFSLL